MEQPSELLDRHGQVIHPSMEGMQFARLRDFEARMERERELVVDPEEIAAYLEADGLNDEVLKTQYGTGQLFDAAEVLYRQNGTGRALHSVARPARPPFPWPMLLRGPLYLIPGLAGLMIGQVLGETVLASFCLAVFFAWGWTMTIAGLRYAEPLGVPGRALRLTLMVALLVGALLGGAAGWMLGVAQAQAGIIPLGQPGSLGALPADALLGALVGGGTALSLSASGVLLALSRMTAAAVSYALQLIAALTLLLIPADWAVPAAWAAFGTVVGVPTLLALWATRTPGLVPANWRSIRKQLRHGLYGWSMALFFLLLSLRYGAGTLWPLVLGAGMIEAGVWNLQQRLQHAARSSVNLHQLWRVSIPTVVVAAGVCAALLAVWLWLSPYSPLPWALEAHPAARYFVPSLGAALLLSAWLSNHGRNPLLTLLWLLASLLLIAQWLPVAPLTWGLTLILLPLTLQALSDPRSYR